MPVRYLFLDEVDAYPPSADDEGEPVALAEARTRTFSWRRKMLWGGRRGGVTIVAGMD
jgi:phage terminase large subunit GpA-like protein